MHTVILALLLLLSSFVEDDRHRVIANAIAVEADGDQKLAFYLLTVVKHESGFAEDVHSGKRKGDQGRSWGLYQVLCGTSADAPVPGTDYKAHEIVGVDAAATRRATHAAAIHLRRFIKRCGGSPACVFRSYGGVAAKDDPRIAARVKTYRRIQFERSKL